MEPGAGYRGGQSDTRIRFSDGGCRWDLSTSKTTRGKNGSYEGALICLTNATAEELKLKAQVNRWATSFNSYANTILGYTQNPLVQSTCQAEEYPLGSSTADAMEDSHPGDRIESAGATINAGGIRFEIDAWNITLQQALEYSPFPNRLTELTSTGVQLWDTFESIVSSQSTSNGSPLTSFVQVSRSIRFTYNL